uniref:Cytosolic fatty-acid binding proteins domain-containing protein n=1 Tax=Gasterosteus aculeatus aculeatus TaxID=481459 RepID=A0AAQ4PL36_GASAC
ALHGTSHVQTCTLGITGEEEEVLTAVQERAVCSVCVQRATPFFPPSFSSPLFHHHGFCGEIRAGEPRKLRRVSGSNWYEASLERFTSCLNVSRHSFKVLCNLTCSVPGLLNAKTDHKVITEVLQDGSGFTWTQSIPNWTWSNKFTVGQDCELTTMKGVKFTAAVTMEGGKISIPFPQYHFTAELIEDKLVMICLTPGEKSVTFRRTSRRI